jgi:hypothetical protein
MALTREQLLQHAMRHAAGLRRAGLSYQDICTKLIVLNPTDEAGLTTEDMEGGADWAASFAPSDPDLVGQMDTTGHPYTVRSGCVGQWVEKSINQEHVTVFESLANFDARVLANISLDDGVNTTRSVELTGRLADGRTLRTIRVASPDFQQMKWVIDQWGTQAVVEAGQGKRDHLRAAIQHLSPAAPERTVYAHTGWRQVDGRWVYLHGGGAIGADGPVPGIDVELPGLRHYRLPAPPTGDAEREAVRASLRLRDVAPDCITMPLLAATYRAALGTADFSVVLAGTTGVGKSELTALPQQHHGPAMDARHLPASWESTENALERQAFVAKDALLTIDDFKPKGGPGKVNALHLKADRVLRGQGNNTGRARLDANLSERPATPPRGLILSSGEDIP